MSLFRQFCLLSAFGCVSTLLAEYPVSRIFYEYGSDVTDLPNLEELRSTFVSFDESQEEISMNSLIDGRTKIHDLSHRDLFNLSEIPLQYLKSLGYEGMVAFPSPDDIHPVSGKDLREIGDTSLTIKIWVSRLGSVSVKAKGGNNHISKSISERLDSLVKDKDLIGKPIKREFLDKLKNYGQHSSRTARVLLSANEESGLVDTILTLSENLERPKFLFSASNSGSKSTGRWLFSGAYFNDQLSGRDDTFGFSYVFSNTMERHGVNTNYYLPFSPEKVMGMGVGVGYSTYDASTYSVTSIDFDGETIFLDLALKAKSQINSENLLNFDVGLNFENVSAFNTLTGSANLAKITPRIGLSLQSAQKNRFSKSAFLLKGNINSISESDQLVVGGIDTSDTYARLILSHHETWKLARMLFEDSGKYLDRHLLLARLEASWALGGNRNLPSHQYITGGSHSIRGYPESIVAGDSGYLFSLEYRIPFYVFEAGERNDVNAFSLIPFFDIATTHVNNSFFYESDHTLMGIGMGIELQLPYGAYARVDFAKPIKELKTNGNIIDGTKSDDYRIHGNLNWKF